MNTMKLCRHEDKTLDLRAGYRYEKTNKKPLSTSDYKVSSGPIKGDVHYDEDMDVSWAQPSKLYWMCWEIHQ